MNDQVTSANANGTGEATSEAPLPPATGSAQHRHLWHNDLCEWYVVCDDCYYPESRNQWGGSTGSRLRPYEREYFRKAAREDYEKAIKCQWCKRPLIPLESNAQNAELSHSARRKDCEHE